MSALTTYSTGTIAVTTGGAVTVTGGIWSGTNVVAGDKISVDGGATVLLSDVSDVTHGQIAGWTGGAVSGKTYVAYQCSPLRFDDVAIAQDLQKQVAALNTDGYFVFVPTAATVPDPSLGDDGQYAFQPSTGKWWAKSGGLWGAIGSPYGLQPAANLSDVANAATARTNLGAQATLGFTPVQQGGGAGQNNNKLYIGWDGASDLKAQVDTSDFGKLWTDFGVSGAPATKRATLQAAKSGANSDITSLAGLTTPLSVAQGGTGDTGTPWALYFPTATPGSGSFGSASATGYWKAIGTSILVYVKVTIGTNGTAAGFVSVLVPFPVVRNASSIARETAVEGNFLFMNAQSGGNIIITRTDQSYAGGDGRILEGIIMYERAA